MRKALLLLAPAFAIFIFGFISQVKGGKDFLGVKKSNKVVYMEGDIIFQSMESDQCKAVKLATHSKFSHVGMITLEKGQIYVLEAIQPVSVTPLDEWIERGTSGYYTLMRLKNRDQVFLPEKIASTKRLGKEMVGKNYDAYFGWSDEKLYCSELVWKLYKRGFDLELCPLKTMRDFDLSSTEVKAIMTHRYGEKPPLEEKVVAPSDLSESKLLYVVEKNNLR